MPFDETNQPNPQEQDVQPERDISLSKLNMVQEVKGSATFDFNKEARYVIAPDISQPTSREESEFIQNDSTLGFEVVDLTKLPRRTETIKGRQVEVVEYQGSLLDASVAALLVDRSQPAMGEKQGYKGLRAGETITPAVIKARFGKDVDFSVSLDQDKGLNVSRPQDAGGKLSVMGFGDASLTEAEIEALRANAAEPDESEVDDITHDRAPQAEQPATEGLSDAARRAEALMLQDEAEIDQRTEELVNEAERERPELSREELEDIGEVPVKETVAVEQEVDSNSSEGEAQSVEQGEADRLKRIYEQNIFDVRDELASSLQKGIKVLDEEGRAIGLGTRTILEGITISTDGLNNALRHYEDYPTGAVQTLIRQTIDQLYQVNGAAGRYEEGPVADMSRAIDVTENGLEASSSRAGVIDGNFESVLAQQGAQIDQVPESAASFVGGAKATVGETQELKDSLKQLSETVGTARRLGIGTATSRLEDILQQSYSRPIDVSELQQIIVDVRRYADEDSELGQAIRKADTNLQSFSENVQVAYARVNPRTM